MARISELALDNAGYWNSETQMTYEHSR